MTSDTATPEELRRILRLIESDPEARAEIRRAILTDELLELPARGAEMDLRHTERMDALTERLDVLTERVDELTHRVDELTQRVDELTQQMAMVVEQLRALGETAKRQNDRLGRLDGWWLQDRWVKHASSYLGSTQYRRIRKVTPEALGLLLDDAEDSERISAEERDDAVLLDALHRTRRKDTGDELWMATEVAARIHRDDVERADRRAKTFEKALSAGVVPCVAGASIDDQALALVHSTGVLVILPAEWRVADAA